MIPFDEDPTHCKSARDDSATVLTPFEIGMWGVIRQPDTAGQVTEVHDAESNFKVSPATSILCTIIKTNLRTRTTRTVSRHELPS
jgi:hypothetical protein